MRFISATHIFDGENFLNNNPILVLDDKNCFVEYSDRKCIDKSKLEHYDGIICPGFVNAHCHLELSHMKDVFEEKSGMLNFAKNIIAKRMTFPKEQIQEGIVEADKMMWKNGIVAVGDISNTPDTFETKQKSKIFYHTFIELIGFNPERADTVFTLGKELQRSANNAELKNSFVPHAPYSVSDSLMQKISSDVLETKYPVSIHNQESEAENLFFKKKEGDFAELYKFLQIPIDFFKPSGYSPLKTYLPNLSNCSNLILVHNTFSSMEDIIWAGKFHKELYWCLCPNANLYIENTLPNINNFIADNCRMIIGTDSLASNHALSITDEINVLLSHFNWIKIADTLKWATSNGAEALGIQSNFGKFIKGKNTGMNQLNYGSNQLTFNKK
ncbi:MAG TPA: amidohydrolase family protein, partial [Bacteroidia bacterium]|nr:amidohydrolase family protein [Bacteroidia bacterium]